MWVYLPAESLVRRISGGGQKGAFMRSDMANEDIEDRAVATISTPSSAVKPYAQGF